jgi:nucleoside-diphosphate-sugar epimerase/glycosyltransferase involved in cell wall biosynthesis
MRILVTGSSGEIGTTLALRLQEEGHDVFGVDRRPNTWTDAFPYALQDLAQRFVNFQGGIGDVIYPEHIDVVVHLAANAKVHELVQSPWRALDNILAVFSVLEFCRVNKLALIFSSSREVYGDVHRFSTEESQTHIAYTESPYSASKIAGEALVYSYAKCYGVPYIVFRFSNVYGRYDNDKERMERVIPLFYEKIAADAPITVYGKDKTLDFTYVDDCVDGIIRGIQRLSSGEVENETINLGFGEGHTLLDVVEYIAETLGKTPRLTIESARVGEVTHYVADISKAKKLLGYDPKVGLKEGISRAVEFYKAHSASISVLPGQVRNDNAPESESDRKKILFFSAFFRPYVGGAEVFMEEVGRRLAKTHAVTILTARLSRTLPPTETVHGMRIVRVGFGFTFDRYLYPFLAFFRSFSIPHDIAYGVLESYAGLALAFYKLFTRRRAILNLQSGTLDDWRRGAGANALLRRLIHTAPDAIHAISRHLAARARWLGAKNIAVIPNGIDLKKSMVSVPRDDTKIACVGRLYPVKGQDIAISAMPHVLKEFPDMRLHLIGDGRDRPVLEALVKTMGIERAVVFRGNVPHDEVAKELASAVIAVGPSRREGQGIAFVEAQAAGTPVIGTNVGGIPEVISDGATGLLVPPENPEALAQAILKLLREPEYAKQLAENAKRTVFRYDWDAITGDVEGLIDRILKT